MTQNRSNEPECSNPHPEINYCPECGAMEVESPGEICEPCLDEIREENRMREDFPADQFTVRDIYPAY